MVGAGVLAIAGLLGAVAEPVTLREAATTGQVTRVVLELKASGRYEPEGSKPLDLKVEERLDFVEKVAAVDGDGTPRRVVRRVNQAAAAVGGKVLPDARSIRPEVAILVAERRPDGPFVFSPGGPLTRAELDLVEGPADPLELAALLPTKPVAVGDRWNVADPASRSLSDYDALAVNGLEATLEAVDDAAAKVALKGEVRGAVLGGEGTIRIVGGFTFDRKRGRIDSLTIDRAEVRKAGPVEAGLDIKSTLKLTRRDAETPPELTDAALAAVPLEPAAELQALRFEAPEGSYTIAHGRDWHLFTESIKRVVLKQLDRGEVVALCSLAPGPRVGPGRHQDLAQFRADIRAAIGKHFVRFDEEGELPVADRGFGYRVVAEGKVGETPVIWIYDLLASPEGEQLIATFALTESRAKDFGDSDLRIIGSFRWGARPDPR
ncbi:MAG TPA: hypothetical protein VG406_27915 [Isosphaeraceae bacterium]|jgi:hypothetical protein|nr:hypothetical protein [Isosphaeraceae bacterium]